MPAASWLTWLRGGQDVGGLPQEHGEAIARMGYTEEQTNALQIATQKTWQKAVEKLAAAGGYNWQMFGNSDGTTPCIINLSRICFSLLPYAPEL